MKYQAQVLHLLHNDQGHQGIERTTALCLEQFYWKIMFQDTTNYVKNVYNVKQQRGIAQIQKQNWVL